MLAAVSVRVTLECWQLDPVSAVGIGLEVLGAAGYLGMWCHVRKTRPWSRWRVVSFLAGLLLIALALQSGFGSYDGTVFWVHLTQHLVLMMAVPPLLAMGAPVTLLLATLGAGGRRRVMGALRDPGMRLVEGKKAPVLLPLDYFGSMFLYMLTPLYRESEVTGAFHDFVHVYFLACGILLWWPLIGMDPTRWRPSYRVKLLTIAAGLPLYILLAVLVAAEGPFISPAHSRHQIMVGALVLGLLGVTLSGLGLVVLSQRQRIRANRRTRRRGVIEPAPAR